MQHDIRIHYARAREPSGPKGGRMTIIAAWWLFGTLALLVAFWFDGEIRVQAAFLAIVGGAGWPLFLPIYLLARYGDRVIWRRK